MTINGEGSSKVRDTSSFDSNGHKRICCPSHKSTGQESLEAMQTSKWVPVYGCKCKGWRGLQKEETAAGLTPMLQEESVRHHMDQLERSL